MIYLSIVPKTIRNQTKNLASLKGFPKHLILEQNYNIFIIHCSEYVKVNKSKYDFVLFGRKKVFHGKAIKNCKKMNEILASFLF